MQEIPRGLMSVRRHGDPLPVDNQTPPIDWQRTFEPGPVKFDPSRPTVLEAEIKAVIGEAMETMDYDRAARRILKIDRIRRALSLLDTIDNPRPTPHSSDAR